MNIVSSTQRATFAPRRGLRIGAKVDQYGNRGPGATPSPANSSGHDWSAFDRHFAAGPPTPSRGVAFPPPVTNSGVPRGTIEDNAENARHASADPFMPSSKPGDKLNWSRDPLNNMRGHERDITDAQAKAGLAYGKALYAPGSAELAYVANSPRRAIPTTDSLPDVFTSKAELANIQNKYGAKDVAGKEIVGRIQAKPTPGTTSYAGDGKNMPTDVAPQTFAAAKLAAEDARRSPRPPVITAGPTTPVPSAAPERATDGTPGQTTLPGQIGQTIHDIPGAVGDAVSDMAKATAEKARAGGNAVERAATDFTAGVQGKTPEEWRAEISANESARALEAKQKAANPDAFTPTRPRLTMPNGMTSGPMTPGTFANGGVSRPPVQTQPVAPVDLSDPNADPYARKKALAMQPRVVPPPIPAQAAPLPGPVTPGLPQPGIDANGNMIRKPVFSGTPESTFATPPQAPGMGAPVAPVVTAQPAPSPAATPAATQVTQPLPPDVAQVFAPRTFQSVRPSDEAGAIAVRHPGHDKEDYAGVRNMDNNYSYGDPFTPSRPGADQSAIPGVNAEEEMRKRSAAQTVAVQ